MPAPARAVMKRALLDQLDEMVKFDLPAEAGRGRGQRRSRTSCGTKSIPTTMATTTAPSTRRMSTRRWPNAGCAWVFCLAEVGRKAEVTVTDAEMTQAVLNAARQYPGQERAFFEFVQKNQQMQQQLRAPLFEDKVIDHIVAQAKVTETEVSKDKLQKAVEALDEM
jgi:trigger factor